MNIIVKKYIQYKLTWNRQKKYEFSCSLGSSDIGMSYIITLFHEIDIDTIIKHSQDGNIGYGSESATFDVFIKNGILFVGIINMLQVDLDKDFDDEAFHYVIRLDDFLTIAKKYKNCLERNILYFYLIYLSSDRVVFATELSNPAVLFPQRWLEYGKVAYLKGDYCYDKVLKTSTELRWFFWLYFRLNSHDKIFEHYEKYREEIPKDLSLEDVKTILQRWDQLKTEEHPVYFVKNDAGKIEVRKSILSLRHVLLERAQDGSYEIKDECGIGVFDFLEEFALGFSPERFLEEYEHAAFSEEIHATHKHIEITYSKQENVIRLKLGKAPYEFEYIERDRDRYFECRLFEMSLYEFVALMMYWRALKENAAAEIYFTQRDDGALVIRESQI